MPSDLLPSWLVTLVSPRSRSQLQAHAVRRGVSSCWKDWDGSLWVDSASDDPFSLWSVTFCWKTSWERCEPWEFGTKTRQKYSRVTWKQLCLPLFIKCFSSLNGKSFKFSKMLFRTARCLQGLFKFKSRNLWVLMKFLPFLLFSSIPETCCFSHFTAAKQVSWRFQGS